MLWIGAVILSCAAVYWFLRSKWLTINTTLRQALQAAERRDWKCAEVFFARAMQVVKTLQEPAQSRYLRTAAVGLAGVFHRRGRFQEAGELLSAALELREPANRFESNDLLLAHDTLGLIRLDQGRFIEAQKSFERALQLCEGIGDKTLILMELQRLGDVFLRQAQFERAEQILLRACEVEREMTSEQLRRSGKNIAEYVITSFSQPEIYFTQKKWSEALPALEAKVSHWERAVTRPDNVDLGTLQMRLADVQGRLGNSAASIETYRRALDTIKRDWTEGHPRVAVCTGALAVALEAGDGKNEAAREALEMFAACGLEAHPDAAGCREILLLSDDVRPALA
jgi:predicted negative regulator of RcsB-dependent stress response